MSESPHLSYDVLHKIRVILDYIRVELRARPSVIICCHVRTLSTVAEKADRRGILRLLVKRSRLVSPFQRCPDPADPSHPPASEGTSAGTVASSLGTDSLEWIRIMEARLDQN